MKSIDLVMNVQNYYRINKGIIYIYMNPTSNLVPTSFPLNPKT